MTCREVKLREERWKKREKREEREEREEREVRYLRHCRSSQCFLERREDLQQKVIFA